MNIEEFLNNIDKRTRVKQIELFFKADNTEIEEIGAYLLIEFKDIKTRIAVQYSCLNKDNYLVYKGFFNKKDAIDYCLDKINTESKQLGL